MASDSRNSIFGSKKDSTANEVLEVKSYNKIDHLYLQSLNHPRIVLVSTPLTGNNYISWNCFMKIALGAKVKLGFINGKKIRCQMKILLILSNGIE